MEENVSASFARYGVNVISDHTDDTGAPVIYEDSPSYESLVGKIEHLAHMGTLFTDFTMVKPGALHKANGGYLVLDIQKVLMRPYAWEGLKRALFSKQISVKSLGEIFSLVSTTSLDPEPIPLDVKVILIGDRVLNYLLCAYDNEFAELFKVSVDFEEQVERSEEHFLLYAQMIGTIARKHKLLALDKQAVARVIEYSSRLSSDASKLSTHMMSISDLVKESHYWAKEEGGTLISREHIQRAIDKQKYRSSRIQERIYEHIKRRSILIETRGEVTGQVNGLSVMSMGNYSFGQPSRITATARLGDGEVMDIEREVELGGAIHSKGVLILSSYIASRYSHDMPLSLNASLVFEQSYGGVEGDSATIAECCALLSVLADTPVRQSLAVTGSMNQFGLAQAIGGVNDKIEGFFEVCKQDDLTGEQGVIIPESNVDNLMLNSDVVDAVAEGKFHIYSISTINEAVSLLMGLEAGEVDENGAYPEGTVNFMVNKKLMQYSQARLEFNKQAKE
jgi:lon-related putative ATP-dependent protease